MYVEWEMERKFYIDLHFSLFIDIVKIWTEEYKSWKTSKNRLKCIKSTKTDTTRVDQARKCDEH